MPSTANGSPCRPATIAAMAASSGRQAGCGSALRSSRAGRACAAMRSSRPRTGMTARPAGSPPRSRSRRTPSGTGTAPGACGGLRMSSGSNPAARGARPVAVEEVLRGDIAPGEGARRDMRLDLAAPRAQPVERRPGGVVEGAQHAGDVAERRGLLAPLGDVAQRLALEVDDHHVVLGDQHLAEMVVAMDAGLQAGGGEAAQALERGRRSPGAPRAARAASACDLLRQSRRSLRASSSSALRPSPAGVDPAVDVGRR